ncbi:hypothetical protein KY330_00405 [Candidatus Woesearchaeota archaeon]|nr:hypothetical protein [Candidatus Woesearchaeota archaeon]
MMKDLAKNNIGKLTGGLLILYVGIVYLLWNIGTIPYHLNVLWPGLVIILGLGILLKYFLGPKK